MDKLTYYTVAFAASGFPVRWLDPHAGYEEKVYKGPFNDPGEARRKFEAFHGANCQYLRVLDFGLKRRELQAESGVQP